MEAKSLNSFGPDLVLASILGRIGFGKFHVIAILISSISFLAEGLESGLLSIISPAIKSDLNLSDTQLSAVALITLVGVAAGAFITGFFSDQIGRLVFIKYSTLLLFISSLTSAFMPDPWTFAACRMLTNAAIGALVPSAAAYVSELSPTHIRGRLMYFTSSFYFIGKIASILVLMAIMPNLEPSKWRLAVLVLSLPAGIVIPFIFIYLVESPYMLLQLGKREEALDCLEYILEINKLPLITDKEASSLEEFESTSYPVSQRVSIIFRSPYLIYVVLLIALFTINTFAGTLIRYALPYTLKETQGTSDVLIGILYYEVMILPAIPIGYYLIDWQFGGRKLSLITAHMLTIGAVTVCIFIIDSYAFVIVLGLAHAGYVLVYIAGIAYNTEIFPTKLRTTGVAISFGISRILSISAPFAGLMLNDIGIIWPYVFALLLTAVGLLASVLLPLETNGMALDSNTLKDI